MKRTRNISLPFVLLLFFGLCGLAAAADADKLHGKWVLNVDATIDASPALREGMPDDKESRAQVRNMVRQMLGDMTFEFDATTMTVKAVLLGESMDGEFTVVKVNGSEYTVAVDGEEDVFTVTDKTLTMTDGDGTFLIFDRQ